MINIQQHVADCRFVVVDVESSGGTTGEHKIIEVGMVVLERGKVVRTYSSLVNPNESIPAFITAMTGITDQMVANAPDEDEALEAVREELNHERAVFVGHNVGFDWGCVSKALVRCGYEVPDVVRLCTCKLARRLLPDIKRHDLATVAEHCNVSITDRHRALGDAEATAQILMALISANDDANEPMTLATVMQLQYVPRAVAKIPVGSALAQLLEDLPNEPGVYYFYSARKKLLYVGKARNLAHRVRSYFSESPLHGRSVSKMVRYIKTVEWATTGSELAALLLESKEIKEKQPSYNVASREYIAPWFITFSADPFPRIEVVDEVENESAEYYGPFRSKLIATRLCDMVCRTTKLRTCNGVLKPSVSYRPCFDYHVGRCAAPCATMESHEDYTRRVEQARAYLGRMSNGALEDFREAMQMSADKYDYEQAALYRDGIREIERMLVHTDVMPLALHELNVIVVMAAIHSAFLAEVYGLRGGKLCLQLTIRTTANLKALAQRIRNRYDESNVSGRFSSQELDDLRIITSWIHQHKHVGGSFVVNGQSTQQLEEQLSRAIAHATNR